MQDGKLPEENGHQKDIGEASRAFDLHDSCQSLSYPLYGRGPKRLQNIPPQAETALPMGVRAPSRVNTDCGELSLGRLNIFEDRFDVHVFLDHLGRFRDLVFIGLLDLTDHGFDFAGNRIRVVR